MLSHHERQGWTDPVQCFDAEAEEPVRGNRHRTHRRTRQFQGQHDLVAGACIAIMLVFVGAPVVGLAVGGATAL